MAKITIKDVAREAGVTVGTVSRAFNSYPDISEETKQKIFKTASALGYVPNIAAKNLSSRTTKNIGIILSDFLKTDVKDSFLVQIMQGVCACALHSGYETMIYLSDESVSGCGLSYKQFCDKHSVSGVILGGLENTDPYLNELLHGEVACVLVDINFKGDNVGYVSIDNKAAMKELVEYVISNNHTKFMLIAGKRETSVNIERLAAVYELLLDRGITLSREDVAYCDFSEEKAYTAVKEYIEKYGKTEATVFMCFSDLMAFGCMRAVKDCGYSIPEDFSVTGFDGHPISAYTSPLLTTVKQDFYQIGYKGTSLLIDMINGNKAERHIAADYSFIEGKSVGRV